MFDYDRLVGIPYSEGYNDCYGLCRRYYREAWGITLPNLARPTSFWADPELDFYSQYQKHGFKTVLDEKLQIGDAFLIPIRTAIASHAAVLVADNLILHHLPGRLSIVESFRPKWANRVNVTIRHPKVTEQLTKEKSAPKQLHEVLDANLLRDPRIQSAIERALET